MRLVPASPGPCAGLGILEVQGSFPASAAFSRGLGFAHSRLSRTGQSPLSRAVSRRIPAQKKLRMTDHGGDPRHDPKPMGGILAAVLAAESMLQDAKDRVGSRVFSSRLRVTIGGLLAALSLAVVFLTITLFQKLFSSAAVVLKLLVLRRAGEQRVVVGKAADSSMPAAVRTPEAPAVVHNAVQVVPTSSHKEADVMAAQGEGAANGVAPALDTDMSTVADRTAPAGLSSLKLLKDASKQDFMMTAYGGKVATPQEVEGMCVLKERVLSLTAEERAGMCTKWLDALTPIDLVRYLRGNGHKTKEAEHKLLASAIWRKQFGVSGILEEHSSSIDGFFPVIETREVDWLDGGADLEVGRPSLLYRSAVHHPQDRPTEDWVRFFVHQCEWARVKYPEHQVLVLVDRVGSGLSNQDPTVLRALTPVILDHYPDMIGRVIIAPVNTVLYVIWGLVSLILDDTTKMRMRLLKGKDWKAQMVKMMSSVAIPERLGGSNKRL